MARATDGNGVPYTPGAAGKVYMATLAHSEEEAVTALTERAALFYGVDPERVGLVITSVEQDTAEEMYSICDFEPVRTETRFSVEGYGYLREVRR